MNNWQAMVSKAKPSTDLTSVRNVINALTLIDADIPSIETLRMLGQIDGEGFRKRLQSAIAGNQQEVVVCQAICKTISPAVINGFKSLGVCPPPSLKTLLNVATNRGGRLAELVEQALETTTPERSDIVEAARQLLAQFTEVEPLFAGAGIASTENDNRPHDLPAGDTNPDYDSVHVYGRKAAFCFSADKTRTGRDPTITVEATAVIAERPDWKNKLSVQLASRELPLMLAFMVGETNQFNVTGHGAKHDKSLTIKRQQGQLFATLGRHQSTTFAVPIPPGDDYLVTSLLIKQMSKAAPHLPVQILIQLARNSGQLQAGA